MATMQLLVRFCDIKKVSANLVVTNFNLVIIRLANQQKKGSEAWGKRKFNNDSKTFLGHLNIIALSGTSIDAVDDIRPIDPVDRNCLFPDETELMNIYQACITN